MTVARNTRYNIMHHLKHTLFSKIAYYKEQRLLVI